MKNNKTYQPKPATIEKKWVLVNADGQTLGRLATRIANILRGKDKAVYAPHLDTGNFVIVTNAAKIKTTGKKLQDKVYSRYSGYPGGLKQISLGDLLEKHPERAIMQAVKGMLPKNRLQKDFLRKLRVFADDNHQHQAQQPEELTV